VGDQEDKVRKDRALKFYEALSGYFRVRPLEASIFLHNAVEGLADVINSNDKLKEDLGYFIGQLKVAAHILWANDHLSVVQKKISDPDLHEDIMDAIYHTTRAYYLLLSGEPIAITNIAYLIDNATSRLYKVIASLVNDANKAC